MVLSPQEESLISVVRALPPQEAVKILDWARQLADLAGGRTVEWSDEDLRDASAASMRRFENEGQGNSRDPATSSWALFRVPE